MYGSKYAQDICRCLYISIWIYDVEKISPVFYGVEAAVNRVPDSDGSTSQGRSSNAETHDVINGFWEGVFDLTLPLEKRTIKVSETFELRSKLGPSTAHLKRSDNPSQDLSQFVGRGGNDFGIFTLHGTYNRQTCELKALKLYDPVAKKRSQSTDNSQSSRNQAPDGRTSKRRRKVSQIIRLREQQALAFKKAEEDAILQKQKRMEERKLLRIQRMEQEKMVAEEREMKRLLHEKAKKKLEKIKLEKLRLKKIQEQHRKLEAEKKRQQQQQQKALKMKRIEESIQNRRIKQAKSRENAIRNASLQQQDQSRSSFHPMSPLNVSIHRDEEDGNGTHGQLRGESTLHALIMKQQRQQLHRGPVNSIYASVNRPMNSRNKHIASQQEEIIEEEDSDDELELPEGVPQIIATVYREPGEDGKPSKDMEFRAAMSYSSGEIYEGQFFKGMRHGLGTCIYVNGDMYEGEWSEGLCHGEGLITNAKGKLVCQGEFVEGRLHGNATFKHEDGSQYTGEWKESRRHGQGKYVDVDGNKYEGEWKDNVRQGHGVHIGVNGSYFEGEWARDLRNGPGYLKLNDGTEYEGTWKANRMEGRGVIKYPDGGRYEGNIRLGKKDGRGKYIFLQAPSTKDASVTIKSMVWAPYEWKAVLVS